MQGVGLIVVWIACVIIGAVAGFLVGYVLWHLGFELLGSAVMLVGACMGGVLVFAVLLSRNEDRL